MQVNEHYWVVVMEPNEKNQCYKGIHYWGSKTSGRWTSDVSQATHYPTLKAAKSKLSYVTNFYKKVTWDGVQLGSDRLYILEANSTVTFTEIPLSEA